MTALPYVIWQGCFSWGKIKKTFSYRRGRFMLLIEWRGETMLQFFFIAGLPAE